jgi:hypothetical protein
MTTRPPRPGAIRSRLRIAAWVSAAFFAYVAWALGPPWIGALWTGLAASRRRAIATGFLNGCLIAYGVVLVGSLVAGAAAMVRLARGRRLRERRPASARVLLLSVASLLGLGLLELGAWGLNVWNRLPPEPPKIPAPLAMDVPSERHGADTLRLLVVGESSAEGQPFQPHFSIGHVVAWQVEQARPGRKVDLVMGAVGGTAMPTVLWTLGQQTQRPDIVLLYAGHNEFQARWGWGRTVNYYPEDLVERSRDGLSDRIGTWTPFTSLIHEAVERQSIDIKPIMTTTRLVVDRPVCEPQVRAVIAKRFAAEVEAVVTWCEQAGAVPILVVPSANDVGYDPNRSVLDPHTMKPERDIFGREFLAARELEATDPKAAMSVYRKLVARQPMFAEAHYRLARLLQAEGKIDEAREHDDIARDNDGLPMRCPSEFQQAYYDLAAKYPSIILVDGPKRLRDLSPTKMLDDNLFQDGHHPSFRAYLALAQDALDQMRGRGLFGLREAAQPPVDPVECAKRFGLDSPKPWIDACRRCAMFWDALAGSRFNASDRRGRAKRLTRAAEAIERGVPPEEAGVPGLGVRPPGFPGSVPTVGARPNGE